MRRFILAPLALSSLYAQEKITFDDHIFPIFESKCLNCHNPDKKKGDLNLSTYLGALAGSSGGKVALAGDGGSSKLYTVTVHTAEPVMPPEGDKIPKKDADLIRAWIDGGLLENKGSKARKKEKPAFDLSAAPTGKRPEGPPPMPRDLLLEPVIVAKRSTVVADIDASPWAPLIAVTGQRQILLYHSDTLELVGILPFPKGQPETVSFHPSGKYLLAAGGVAGKSGTTITWDITTGKEMMSMGKEFDSVLAADLRADLGGVALGGPSRLVKLWDTQTVEQINSIKKHTDWVTALAYSHDGVLLATGDRNNGVQIWESFTGNEFHSLRGHQKGIVDIKWRADSNLVASASEDGFIIFWDMNQGKEIKKTNAHSGGVLAMDYNTNGKLISVGRDKRVKVWKPDLSLEKQSEPFADLVTEVAFSHDGNRCFTADWNGKIEVWDSTTLKKVGELNGNPPSIKTRLASMAQTRATLEAGIQGQKQKADQAAAVLKAATEKLAATENTIAQAKEKEKSLGKEIGDLSARVNQLKGEAQKKELEIKTVSAEAQKPDQQHKALADQRRELAAGQQALQQEQATAKQALVAATRDTQIKREASGQDPGNAEKKADLVTAEQAEHQQRLLVQQFAPRLEEQKKRLAAHSRQMKDLQSGMVLEDARIKALQKELDEFNDRHDQTAQLKGAKEAELTRQQKLIPELTKQIAPLKKAIEEKTALAKAATEEFAKSDGVLAKHDAEVKKWKAATINTRLIQTRTELENLQNELPVIKDEKPEELPAFEEKIAGKKQDTETLLAAYQAAK
ncbi:c-type cytochrome domain-containing protein [Verrucomicrobiaceae bacterium 227]